MKLLRSFPALALAAAFALPVLAQEDPAAPEGRKPGYMTLEILKKEIRTSLDWLAAQQDPQTGAYGDVQITCFVLIAFAESPWRYTHEDGPFVAKAIQRLLSLQRDDGAICDPDANRLMERVHTGACIDALEFFREAPGVPYALAGCKTFTYRPATHSSWEATLAAVPSEQIYTMAEDKLWNRKPEGWWEHPFSRVRATAVNIGRLNGYYQVLDKRENNPVQGPAVPQMALSAADQAKADAALARGAAFLVGAAEEGRWGFPGKPDPGITAMVTGALLATPEPRTPEVQAAIDGALEWLVSLQKEDGSIHAGQLKNYITAASILALVRAGRDEHREVITRARDFLKELQVDEGEGYAPSDLHYGGIGYGGDGRADLSNLQMALEALNATGLEADDPTITKAVSFLERCQNRSESNKAVLEDDAGPIKSGDDGGSAYAPLESKAGYVELPDGTRVARSYGSMTYALLKAYLFAGLPKSDPRVQAAWKWLRENYTLEINPGFETSSDPTAAYQGLFYYFYTMARALDLFGEETVVDPEGTARAWRGELIGRMTALQRQDGSWINENAERWYEGNPVLATAYALMTLEIARGARAETGEAAGPATGGTEPSDG
ncbi:MAG: prenyltransferase/squalene oxidase repeat-containing protein [Planctomycetota bacterium]